jgi:hypothetical protein
LGFQPNDVPAAGATAIKVRFSRSYPEAPATVELLISLRNDDLDLARAQPPAGLRVTAWRRR